MPSSEYTPSVAQVGSLLRARTVDTNGQELGTFTAQTRPTETQVALLIETATGELAAKIGSTIHADFHPLARTAATYRAASLVEISYFPEQVATGRSPYEHLRDLWTDTLASLSEALDEAASGGHGSALNPSYKFETGVLPLDYVMGVPTVRPPYSGGLYQ